MHKASIGETVTLTCAVDANPAALITWRRREAASGSFQDVPEFGNSPSVTLEVDANSFGEYLCQARSPKYPRVFETIMNVLEKTEPRIRSVAQVHATVRGAAHLPCTIDAVPKPLVTWLRNGVPLTKDAKYAFNEEEFLGGLTSILTINSVEKNDFGDYNCTAINELGSLTRRVTLLRVAETNIDLAIGGSVGALLALVCILILSGIMLKQRRKKRTMHKRRQVSEEAAVTLNINMYDALLPKHNTLICNP